MAKRGSRHRGAFMMGLLLGGAAAAAAAVWNSPQAGRKTREQIMEAVEQGLFTLLGAGEADERRTREASVATNASNRSRPRRIVVKSVCICRAGAASKRTTGSGRTTLNGRTYALS